MSPTSRKRTQTKLSTLLAGVHATHVRNMLIMLLAGVCQHIKGHHIMAFDDCAELLACNAPLYNRLTDISHAIVEAIKTLVQMMTFLTVHTKYNAHHS